MKKGVYCTGTIRPNRKNFPVNLIPSNKKAQMGSYRFATCSNHPLTAVWWKDRRDVYAISTLHKKSVITVLKKPKGSKEKQSIPCPEMINDYNHFMGGVDLCDQCLSYYSMSTRKTLKWWKKVFWRFLDMCVLNSWIIFRTNFPQSDISTQKLFRLQLIKELVQPLLTLKSSPTCPAHLRPRGRVSITQEARLIGKHFPYKNTKRKWCAVCSSKPSTSTGKRSDKKLKIFVPNAKYSFVWGNVLKCITHR